MAHWKETSAAVRRLLGRRPLLLLGASVTVVALALRALAPVSQPAAAAPESASEAPSQPAACPPRSLSDAGVCVPAPHPETALALAEAQAADVSHDSLTPPTTPPPAAPDATDDPTTTPPAPKFELEAVDDADDEKPRRALRENPPEFERGAPEETPEETPETE